MSVFFDLTGKCRIKTVDEAIFFAGSQVLDISLYKGREEIFFLKLAKMMKGIGALRAAGRCYMKALYYSLKNEQRSNERDGIICVSNPEKIHKMALHFYVDLGSYNYLKTVNKFYRIWSAQMNDNNTFHALSTRLNKERDVHARVERILETL